MSDLPSVEQLRNELRRERLRRRALERVAAMAGVLLVAVAVAVICATLIFPVMRISSSSMMPGLETGDVVIAVRHAKIRRGDVISFYYNNDVLVKRVVAMGGETVDITPEGVVTIDGQALDEPYVVEPDRGDCTMDFPLIVPENRYFVMGDFRRTSLDSRSTIIGCVDSNQILGKVFLCVWPFEKIGPLWNTREEAQK